MVSEDLRGNFCDGVWLRIVISAKGDSDALHGEWIFGGEGNAEVIVIVIVIIIVAM